VHATVNLSKNNILDNNPLVFTLMTDDSKENRLVLLPRDIYNYQHIVNTNENLTIAWVT